MIRPESAQQFDLSHAEFLTRLAPHLGQAFQMARSIERANSNTNALLLSLAQLGYAVIALDDNHEIINYSSPAKAFLDQRDGIRVHNNRIEAIDPNQNLELRRMIEAASHPWDNPRPLYSQTLRLSRKSSDKPLHVVVRTCLSQFAPGLLEEDLTRVLVFVSDPSLQCASRGEILRSSFGLTPTEARLADFLLQGCDVKETAERMRITENTARYQHLRQVFDKTGARGQLELLRLMLSFPGVSLP